VPRSDSDTLLAIVQVKAMVLAYADALSHHDRGFSFSQISRCGEIRKDRGAL
jgi:hypothetical protein